MSLTIDNQQNIDTTQDIQEFLLEPSTTYPTSVVNNIPNSGNVVGGEYPVWNGSTFGLQGSSIVDLG